MFLNIWFFPYISPKHGGVYVKRSAKFDEKAMKKKLLSQTKLGTPVSFTFIVLFLFVFFMNVYVLCYNLTITSLKIFH